MNALLTPIERQNRVKKRSSVSLFCYSLILSAAQ